MIISNFDNNVNNNDQKCWCCYEVMPTNIFQSYHCDECIGYGCFPHGKNKGCLRPRANLVSVNVSADAIIGRVVETTYISSLRSRILFVLDNGSMLQWSFNDTRDYVLATTAPAQMSQRRIWSADFIGNISKIDLGLPIYNFTTNLGSIDIGLYIKTYGILVIQIMLSGDLASVYSLDKL